MRQWPAPDFALAVLKGLSHLAPHTHVLKLKNEDFSRDQKLVAAMNADPLIAGESQPTLTVAAMVRANERLKRDLHLMICRTDPARHGRQGDEAPGQSGIPRQGQFSRQDLKFSQGYFHAPLNDIGKEAVMADIKSWVFGAVAEIALDALDFRRIRKPCGLRRSCG